MIPEIFLPVKGFEGIYEISIFGNVKALGANGSGKSKKSKIMNHWDNGRGYRYITLAKDKKHRNYYIHRLIADAFLSEDNSRPHVNHKNGVKSDNHILNLERCSLSENMTHAADNGLLPIGENNHLSKLTQDQVIEIRVAVAIGIHRDKISEYYGISYAQIHRIALKKNWKHIA